MHVPSKVSTIKIITPDPTEMAITVAEFDGGLPEENPFANSQKDYVQINRDILTNLFFSARLFTKVFFTYFYIY